MTGGSPTGIAGPGESGLIAANHAGTGTFGDMGCHIYDPVYKALALTAPLSVRSEGEAPNEHSWATDALIRYVFPGTVGVNAGTFTVQSGATLTVGAGGTASSGPGWAGIGFAPGSMGCASGAGAPGSTAGAVDGSWKRTRRTRGATARLRPCRASTLAGSSWRALR